MGWHAFSLSFGENKQIRLNLKQIEWKTLPNDLCSIEEMRKLRAP